MRTAAETFPHRRAGHCGSGALRDLLEHHGLDFGSGPLSEGTVFGLAGGLGFFFAEIPQIAPPIYLVGRTGDLERDVAAHLNAEIEVRETDDPVEGWAWVTDEIDAGRPPMVWADIAELEYLRVRMSNTRHDIVVVDYDSDAQVAWIADNDRDELQRCSLDSLAAARNSSGFPGPNRHTTFLYRWPDRLPDPGIATQRALACAVRNMRTAPASVGGLDGGLGLAGVAAFCESYPRWPETFATGMDEVLRGLRVFIVKAGTGGAMFRSLHAEFLREMAGALGGSALLAAASIYEELAARWVDLATCAEAGDHAAGLPLVEEIGRLEVSGVAAMEAAL
ncbi:MAG: BtrH N-terminal domain-containing protein [Solirubrobacteraceae bacterium]